MGLSVWLFSFGMALRPVSVSFMTNERRSFSDCVRVMCPLFSSLFKSSASACLLMSNKYPSSFCVISGCIFRMVSTRPCPLWWLMFSFACVCM